MPATEVMPDEWQEDDTVRILRFGGFPPRPKPRWRTGAGSVSERPGPPFLFVGTVSDCEAMHGCQLESALW